MLSNKTFYHRLTKKYVTIFGNIFNNISVINFENTNNTEIERIKVPIIYSPKEKWVTRLNSDGPLAKQIQVALPRMGFEITGMRYAQDRKQITTIKHGYSNTSTQFASQYMGVPWDIDFELSIYARHLDHLYQIIEQIVPYFTPDYTVSLVTLIPAMGLSRDLPVTLGGLNIDIQYEGGQDEVRYAMATLDFTMQAHYFGPVATSALIKHAIVNFWQHPELQSGYITKIALNDGNNGDYPIDSWVFQGNSEPTATATAKVIKWDKPNSLLYLGGTQGNFKANNYIYSVETNAKYNLLTFNSETIKMANVSVSPNPPNANADDPYGFTTVITEFPDTIE